MESKFRRLAPPGGDYVTRKLERLERDIVAVRTARRMEAATIGRGGVTVEDGGDVALRDGGSLSVEDGGDVRISSGGSVVVEGGGGLAINSAGNVDVFEGGAVRVWGSSSIGTLGNGEFGVATLDAGGNTSYPSTIAKPDGFLCDAGPGLGYAVYRVDEATGAAVVTSSVGKVLLPYQTTSEAANTRILLDGSIWMVSSSLRYKQDVEDHEVDPDVILQMRPRSWRDRAQVERDPDTDRRYVGFIAEELDDLGLSEFVEYDEDGRPNSIAYDRLSVGLLAVVQQQSEQIGALTARVDALEDTTTTRSPRG